MTVQDLLDKAADRLDGLAGQPEVEAEIRAVIGHAYEYLGVPARAELHYRRLVDLRSRLLGPDGPEAIAARNRLCWAVVAQGRLENGEPMAVATYDACKRTFGEEHEATAEAANNLGEVRSQQGRYAEAVALRRRASRVASSLLGPDHETTLIIDSDLAVSLVRVGEPAEATPLLQSVVARRRRLHPRHPEMASTLSNLGGSLVAVGRYPEAEVVLKETIALSKETGGSTHPVTLASLNLISCAWEGQERWREAEQGFHEVLKERIRADGGKPPSFTTRRTMAFLARLYAKQQRWSDAAPLLGKLVVGRSTTPPREPGTLDRAIAAALAGTAEPEEGERLMGECRETLKPCLWAGDWLGAELASRQGDYLRRQGKFAAAEPVLIAAADEVRKGVGVPSWGVASARKRVAALYEAWGRPAEAAKWR